MACTGSRIFRFSVERGIKLCIIGSYAPECFRMLFDRKHNAKTPVRASLRSETQLLTWGETFSHSQINLVYTGT